MCILIMLLNYLVSIIVKDFYSCLISPHINKILPLSNHDRCDRKSALADLQKLIAARLAGAEVVSLEIEMSKPQNPWLHFAGMLKDDPYFDQMQEDIAGYRREKDAEFAIRKLRDGLNF